MASLTRPALATVVWNCAVHGEREGQGCGWGAHDHTEECDVVSTHTTAEGFAWRSHLLVAVPGKLIFRTVTVGIPECGVAARRKLQPREAQSGQPQPWSRCTQPPSRRRLRRSGQRCLTIERMNDQYTIFTVPNSPLSVVLLLFIYFELAACDGISGASSDDQGSRLQSNHC